MKKLVVTAVLSALAAPAFADSGNVTISGWIESDVYLQESRDGLNNKAPLIDIDGRLNFTGTEDLGNGLKTIWQIGSKIDENGSYGFGTNDTYLGLEGSFGKVRMGKMLTPWYEIVDWPLSAAGMGRIMDRGARVGSVSWALGDRVNNSVRYDSPDMGGFSASAMYYTGENKNSSGLNSQAWSGRVAYANGPFNAAVGLQSERDIGGVDGQKLNSGVFTVGYDFGNGFGVYGGAKHHKLTASAGTSKRTTWMVGATYAANDKLSFRGAYGQAGDEKGATAANNGAKELALQVNYALSKRSSVHLRYNRVKNDPAVASDTFLGDGGKTGKRVLFIMAHSF